ncbi:MAG TPA: hypothetical protein VI522_06505 [Gammaproteobacteria bacterium]|nr:hypothetical protein [Gammaproteobacteria bacterium]
MSISDQLRDLEACLQAMHHKCQLLQQENRQLHSAKQSLHTQNEVLLKKNEAAKVKVTQLLSQLTQMDVEHG